MSHLTKHMNFLPLFIQPTQKEQEQATSYAIPDSTLSLNKKIIQLLEKNNPICPITAIVHSERVRKFIRAIFLQINQESQQFQQFGNIGMYAKMQVGYNNQGQSFNWVYFQVMPETAGKLLNMMTFISSAIIYEPVNIEFDRNFMKQTAQNYKKFFRKIPQFYIVQQQSQNLHFKTQQQINLQQLNIPNKWPSLSSSLIQKSIQTAHNIVNNTIPLRNDKGSVLSCSFLPCFFIKWQKQSNYGEINEQKIWNQSIDQFQTNIKNKCVQQYRHKMPKFYEDKKFITMKLLRNSHQISMQIALKSVQKYKVSSQNFTQYLQRSLNSQLNKFLQYTTQLNLKWGKNFIQRQFVQIEIRLKNKQLKLQNCLKQQFNLFIEYFNKKTQGLSCKKLQYYLQQFIINKAFDYSNYIHEQDKKNIQQQLTQIKNKLSQTQIQIKQNKKQYNKQISSYIKTIQQQNQHIKSIKNHQQLLQSTMHHLKQLQQQSQIDQEQKIRRLGQQYMQQIKTYKDRISILLQQLSSVKHYNLQLQSDVEKQKQMHKHTKQYYNNLIAEFKSKQQAMRQQIEQISMRASHQLEVIKRDSFKQINQSNINKSNRQKQQAKLLQQINILTNHKKQLQNLYNNLQYQMQLKKAQNQICKNDMQISLKISQQKVLQYQSRLPRYNKLQQQITQYQKLLQQLTQHQQIYEKQTALLRQQNNFINQEINILENKYESQKNSNIKLKANVQELEERIGKFNKVKVNQWVQTDQDTKLKQMLEQALKYKKLKAQNNKLKTRLFQY